MHFNFPVSRIRSPSPPPFQIGKSPSWHIRNATKQCKGECCSLSLCDKNLAKWLWHGQREQAARGSEGSTPTSMTAWAFHLPQIHAFLHSTLLAAKRIHIVLTSLSLPSLGTLELRATWLQSISLERRHNELACKLSFYWSASLPSSSELSLSHTPRLLP